MCSSGSRGDSNGFSFESEDSQGQGQVSLSLPEDKITNIKWKINLNLRRTSWGVTLLTSIEFSRAIEILFECQE